MLISELKPLEEILGYLESETNVFVLGCRGCAEVCETGGEAQVLQMKEDLEKNNKKVVGYTALDFLCDRALIKLQLKAHEGEISASDSVLVMSCGVGIQATAASVKKFVHPACNTLSVGGAQGEWPGSERCGQCGNCLLDMTGGICPITMCTKSLVNGPCGGTKNGMCEVEPDVRECGWHLIYERLKELGRLDKMKEIQPLKAYSKMQPPKNLRSTVMWALEQREKEQ